MAEFWDTKNKEQTETGLLFVFYHSLFSKYITESLIKSLFTGSSGSIVSQATERLSPLPENAIFRSNRDPLVSEVGTEELGHLEMIGAIVYQLTKNLSLEEIKKSGFDTYFVDHTTGIYPTAASGFPWSAASMQSKGDTITDLHEDLAAEQKARTTYDNILRLVDDPDVREPIKFLREREIVHYQRFGDPKRSNGKNNPLYIGQKRHSARYFCYMFQIISSLSFDT